MWYRRLALSAILATFATGASVAAPGAISFQSPAAPTVQVQPVVYPSPVFGTALNAFRATHGRGAVRANAELALAAQRHANYLAAKGILSHTGRGGSTIGQRARAAGCNWSVIAENVAGGYSSVNGVIRAWANSSGHRANMLKGNVRVYGLGRSNGYWVLMLADRC